MVRLAGRLDSHTTGAVRERLHAAVRDGDGPLLIDLSALDTIDATGLGVLVGTHRLAEQAGRPIALRGTPKRLQRLLRVTRLDRFLPTVEIGDPVSAERPPAAVGSAA
ncbi:MAG TPA: STAS domain-containing protein [Actinocatenispora sp.]